MKLFSLNVKMFFQIFINVVFHVCYPQWVQSAWFIEPSLDGWILGISPTLSFFGHAAWHVGS